MNKAFFMLIAAVPLSGCTSATVDDPFLATSAATTNAPALAVSVAPDYALAGFSLDAPVSVRQTVLDTSAEQTIVYANATALEGENTLTIAVAPPGTDKRFKSAPSRAEIQAEMRTALGRQPMEIRNEVGENAYGVFGYATGPLGQSGSCLYAWQVAHAIGPSGSKAYAAQIRLRYCSPSQSTERVAAMMQSLRIKPVSADTLRMLRLAAGSGALAAAPQARIEPVPVAQTVIDPAAQDVAYTPPPRTKKRIVRQEAAQAIADPVAADTDGSGQAVTAETTPSASVKVPLPGETASMADAAEKPVVAPRSVVADTQIATPSAQPSIIPLPAALSGTAQ